MNLTEVHAQNVEALKVIYSSLVILSKVFYSLNFQVSKQSDRLTVSNITSPIDTNYIHFAFRIYQNFSKITWPPG